MLWRVILFGDREVETFMVRVDQRVAELAAAHFVLDPAVPLREHNAPRPGSIRTGPVPVIYEAAFRRTGAAR